MTDALAPVLMTADLSRPAPPPRWPDGISLAGFASSDAPETHRLLRAAYAGGGGSVPAGFEAWWQATRDDEEFDPALCFVAKAADGTIVGFALCWTSGFLKDLVVDPAFRRRGVGEALLLAARATLRARGHGQLALKVQAGNAGARRLYERLGFATA